MSVAYSPLCDTDPELYLAYLACRYREYGQRSVVADGEHWGGRDGARHCCGAHFVSSATTARGLARIAQGIEYLHVGGDGDIGPGDSGAFGDSVRAPGGDQESAVGGAASSFVGSRGGMAGSSGGGECGPAGNCDESRRSSETVGILNTRGKHYAKNKAKRARRAAAVRGARIAGRGGYEVGCDDGIQRAREVVVDDSSKQLRDSLCAKWRAENSLAEEKAKQQLELLRSRDIEQLKRADSTRWRSRTERNMVAIEKDHATLRATGNVPGLPAGGFAETVVSNDPGLSSGECSISPSSSISEAEVRCMQKSLEDLRAEIEKRDAVFEKMGVSYKHYDKYSKESWTATPENDAILDEMYPDGYALEPGAGVDGKNRLIVC